MKIFRKYSNKLGSYLACSEEEETGDDDPHDTEGQHHIVPETETTYKEQCKNKTRNKVEFCSRNLREIANLILKQERI